MNSTTAEVNAIVNQFHNIVKDFKPAQIRQIMRPAAKMVAREIAAAAPVSPKVVSRYKTAKLSHGMRAPKGSGNVVAKYTPGNLGRSIAVLTFRKSAALFIGPATGKKARNNNDGYYAHLVEFGVPSRGIAPQPFIRSTWAKVKPAALSMVEIAAKKVIEKYTK